MSLQQKLQLQFVKLDFNRKAQRYFLEILAELVSYNLSMQSIFSQLLPEVYPKGGMNFIVKDIAASLSAGTNLSDALKKWLPPQLVAMIKTGEMTGRLAEGLKIAGTILESSGSKFFNDYMKGISYGLAVWLGSLGILLMFAIKVLPVILPFLKGKVLPFEISGYIAYYTFILEHGILTVIVFFIVVGLLVYTLRSYVGKLRPKLDQMPIFKIYRQISSQRLLEEISQYFRGNLLIDTAIDIMLKNGNSRYYNSHLQQIKLKLSQGTNNIALALDTGLFDNHIMTILVAMGKVNKFEEKSGAYAEIIKKELTARIEKSAVYTHSLLMFISAINIGWSMLAMYSSTSLIGG